MTTHDFLHPLAFAATIGFAALAAASAHAQTQSANASIRFINPATLSSAPRIASKPVEIPAGPAASGVAP